MVIKSDDRDDDVGDFRVSMTILMIPSPMHHHDDDDQDENESAEIINIGRKNAAHNHQISFTVSNLDLK